jgi:hypothetical protein
LVRADAKGEWEEARRITAKVKSHLAKISGKCAICEDEDHHPNKCRSLKTVLQPYACFLCFGAGHRVDEATATLAKYKNAPNSREMAEKKRKDAVLNGCAIVYSEHVSFKTFEPCTSCWLQHDPMEKGQSCFTSSWHVRACMLKTWYHPPTRIAFIKSMKSQGAMTEVQEPKTWTKFHEWAVYGGNSSLQNAYLVLLFHHFGAT